MELDTKITFEIRCLNCRELDHADTREQAEEKAKNHLGLDAPGSIAHRGGLGHSTHRMVITECTLVHQRGN